MKSMVETDVELKSAKPKVQSSKHPKFWGPVAATLWPIVLFIASQIVILPIIYIYPALHHMSGRQIDNWYSNSIPIQFVTVLCAEAFVVYSVWLLLRHYKATFKKIGLVRPRLMDLPLALIGFAVSFGSVLVLFAVLQVIFPSLNLHQKQDVGFQQATSAIQLALTFLSLVILPPIAEEILFRGFTFTGFRRKFGFIFSMLATSILFAIPHLLESANGGLLWVAGIDTFILSIVLCFLREKTGRLIPGMGVHALNNFVAFYSLYLLKTH